jgi:hypothetical protein
VIKQKYIKNNKNNAKQNNQTNKKPQRNHWGEISKQTRNKQANKQTNKNSRFRINTISVLVQVLVLLLQYPVLLEFMQKLCLSLARWLACG